MENSVSKDPIKTEFEYILDALEAKDFNERARKLGNIASRIAHGQLDDRQIERLYNLAKAQYSEGAAAAGSWLINLIAFGGPSDSLPYPDCLFLRYCNSVPRRELVSGIEFEFLKHNNIVPPSETYLIAELGSMFFENSRNYRVGGIILTERNLVMIGPYVDPYLRGTHCRLYYEEPESKWYLPSMDILEISGISNVEHRNKEIQFKYRTEYYKEKTSTLYGPLFFKWEISRRPKLYSGELNVRIKLSDVVWSSSTPEDYTHLRTVELQKGIETAMASIELV